MFRIPKYITDKPVYAINVELLQSIKAPEFQQRLDRKDAV